MTGRRFSISAICGLALALGACGDDDSPSIPAGDAGLSLMDGALDSALPSTPPNANTNTKPAADASTTTPIATIDGGSAGGNDGGAVVPAVPPVYVFTIAVQSPENEPDTYVALSRSPDLKAIDISKARIFAPYSGVAVIDGHIFIGDANGPFVTKYKIEEDLSWKQVAAINFGDFPLPEGETLNFYFGNFKNETVAYHHYGEDKSWRIHWNPREAKIVASHTDTKLPAPTSELAVGGSGNRTDVHGFKGPIMQPFHQTVLATDDYGPQSFIVVYDENTHAEKSVTTIEGCPGLEQTTMDEQGDLYFSTTYNIPIAALFKKGLASCVVKFKADGTLDSSFAKTDLSAWTGGHYAVNFRYLADGKATAHVLHEERATGINFSGAVPSDIGEQIEDPKLWEFELIDLVAGTSKPFTGVRPGDDVGYYGRQVKFEGRTYLSFPFNDWEKSVLYELHTDGSATLVVEMTGEVWNASRLR